MPPKPQKKRQKQQLDDWAIRVSHEAEEFEDGTDVILTLQDQHILDEKGRQLADGEDVLESIALKEQHALEKRLHDKEKLNRYKGSKMAYDVYEENTVVREDGTVERKLLPQYDLEEEKRKASGKGMVIKGGVVEDPKAIERRRAAIRAKLSGKTANGGKVIYDISGPTVQQASDYYTPNEVSFKPRKKRKTKKRMKKRLDSDEEDIVGGGPNSNKAAQLEPMEEGEVGDFGSRNADAVSSEQAAIDAENERRRRYREAVAKAEAVGKEVLADDEEDTDLVASMARARKAAMQMAKASEEKKPAVLSLVKKEKKEKKDDDALLVISETSEFVRAVPDAQEQYEAEKERLQHAELKERQLRVQIGAKEEDKMEDKMEIESPVEEGGWREVDEEEEKKEESDLDNKNLEEELPVGVQKAASASVANALELLRSQGVLDKPLELAGRNRDEKSYHGLDGLDKEAVLPDKGKERRGDRRRRYSRREEEEEKFKKEVDKFSDIKLEYLDEFGRHMTPKEAFRHISHVFHGKAPGKNKQEKRLKQYYEELQLKKMAPGDTPLQSAEKMRVLQETTGNSYIVLKGSGAVKPLLGEEKLRKKK